MARAAGTFGKEELPMVDHIVVTFLSCGRLQEGVDANDVTGSPAKFNLDGTAKGTTFIL